MKNYKNVEEITAAFIAEGWNDPKFTEATPDQLKATWGEKWPLITKNKKCFVMQNGNIYSENGKILSYNLKANSKI